MPTALVIDDHPVTHLGCAPLLQDAGFDVVVNAITAEEGLNLCGEHKPELVVLDLELAGRSGLALIGKLASLHPTCRILIFSMHDDPAFAACAVNAGAHGYITKNASSENFLQAIARLLDGGLYIEHDLATELAILRSSGHKDALFGLSARELEVLKLIGDGKSHSEIATHLEIGYKTVINTCSSLKQKLGAQTLSDLIRIALEETKSATSNLRL